MTTQVHYKNDGPIARITFDGPKGVNILATSVLESLEARLQEAAKNAEIRVLILTGAERTFIAGADIAEMSDAGPDAGAAFSRRGQACFNRLARLEQVVTIAAINGPAMGGGCELALACDIRLMSDTAKIGLPEVKIGLVPGWGGTQRLLALVGPAHARKLIFTGEPVDAAEAARIGLVDQAVPAGELMAAAEKLATRILANGPTAVRLSKRAIHAGEYTWLEGGLAAEAIAFGEAFGSAQGREGLKAFLEKRPAKWSV